MTFFPTGLPGILHRSAITGRTSDPTEAAALREWLSAHRHHMSAVDYGEAIALFHESDPRLLDEGLLSFAGRLERSDSAANISIASQIYHALSRSGGPEARRASERLAVLQGGGPTGARAEFLLRGFARQASDPAMLLGMGLASGVFSITRAATLSRLLSIPGHSVFTRGMGARSLASLAGFAVEAPVFALGSRLGAEALGRPQDWSLPGLGRDTASAYLILGALKLSHAFGTELLRARLWPAGNWPIRNMGEALLRPSLTLGGIYLGHRLEVSAGLRESRPDGQLLLDSLATLLQFHVAGRLSEGFLGRPFGAMEASLDHYSQVTSPAVRSSLGHFGDFLPLGLQPAFAKVPGVPRSASPDGPLTGMQISMMSALGTPGGARGESVPLGARIEQLVRPRFSEKSLVSPPRSRRGPTPEIRRVGILTSGGDGPGENAAIAALVRGAIRVHGWKPVAIFDGYRGLLEPEGRVHEFELADVEGEAAVRGALQRLYGGRIPPGLAAAHADIATLGGDILRSSRTNPVQGDLGAERVKATMRAHGIDALIVLGGNGSMRAANALREAGVSVVGIPQSIDMDVWGSEHSIGFPSAVAKGAGEIHHFYNTAHSCDRWFLVEVMGQHYGMLTLAIGHESRIADSVFIEVPRPLNEVRDAIERARPSRWHGVLLFSEGVKFRGDGVSVIEPPRGTDVHGRLVVESGDVVRWLRAPLAEMGIVHTRPESLGYLLRGAEPTSHEIDLAQALANGALRLVEAGSFGRMVGTEFAERGAELQLVYPPLERVARFQKPPPEEYFLHVRDRLEGRGQ